MIGRIAVSAANFAIDKPYSYFIPDTMTLQPGMRVLVPFGRSNRHTEGVVLQVEPGLQTGLKTVLQQLDDAPVLSETMLHLAAFLRDRCFCTFYEVLRAMLPAGLWFQEKDTYRLTQERSWQQAAPRNAQAAALLQILEENGGQASEELLRKAIPEEALFQKTVSYLQRKKWIEAQRDFHRRTTDKTQKIALLAVSSEEALSYAAGRTRSALMQKSVLELMCAVGCASVKEICYFTGAGPRTVSRLAELGFLKLQERETLRIRQIKPAVLDGPLQLNAQQQAAFDGLAAQMQQGTPGVALLHGVTGSGKTSVYIKLIQSCLEQGKQAMLLVPEISLTPQLLSLLAAYFGDHVAVLHSSLPTAERYDQWKRIRNGDAPVVVGTRSAVFAPCAHLGILILDEEQEHSYRSENTPRYHAKEAALWRGLKEKALVLFGSATPSIETMYHAKTGKYQLYTLPDRFNGKSLPKVEIVDMRRELEAGNDLSLSLPLQEALEETIRAGQQSILFLNRRGNSRALMCVQCAQVPECPRCNARLTYHSVNERLMCHYCGYSQPAYNRCPQCGGAMKRMGTGTQKIQQELQAVLGGISVDRMDADTVSATNTHEKILEHFEKEQVPVLIGTQMVTKGLNLPKVTLVGVLDADLSLYTDSYRAAETTFNMLTQVVGRSGRGAVPGRALIQTMVPEHKVIALAAKQDYDSFYQMELSLRRIQRCPPFGDIATITVTGQEETAVLRGAVKLRDSLLQWLQQAKDRPEHCSVLGPAPCPVPKINYHFRYRLTLRCSMTQPLRLLLAELLRQFSRDKANRGITAYVEVNGYD